MTTHPNCKINLGLHVVSKRPDGYHNLETIFVPVNLTDTLSMHPSDEFSFVQDGLAIDGDPMKNLVVRAYELLKADFPHQVRPVAIQLTKTIPFGAGLGGGSADAAFALKMVNEMFELGLDACQLKSYAARLGADCPFFVDNRPVYATGIGDEFSQVAVNLEGYRLVIVKPDCFVSTADAYRGLTPRPGEVDLREAVQLPIAQWRDKIVNHFEASIFAKCPEVKAVKQMLYDCGALYASMSGSGSAVFGIFDQVAPEQFKSLPTNVKSYIIQ